MGHQMVCTCNPPRTAGHRPDCTVATAMRVRCPGCHSRRRDKIVHAKHCELKEYQP